jgi:hypothetical protein
VSRGGAREGEVLPLCPKRTREKKLKYPRGPTRQPFTFFSLLSLQPPTHTCTRVPHSHASYRYAVHLLLYPPSAPPPFPPRAHAHPRTTTPSRNNKNATTKTQHTYMTTKHPTEVLVTIWELAKAGRPARGEPAGLLKPEFEAACCLVGLGCTSRIQLNPVESS